MAVTYLTEPHQRVIAASGLSNLADGIRMVALPLLAVQLGSSPLVLALVVAAGEAPWLLFGLWAGALTDRSNRRDLAARVALTRVALLLTLAVLIVVDAVPLGLLVVASFVLGISEVLADNVNSALVPLLVADSELERANSRMVGAAIAGNELVGPAIGGLLFAAAAAVPFFTNATLLALSFVLLAGLPLMRSTIVDTADSFEPSTRIREGIDVVLQSKLLRTITWSSALLAAVDGAWFTLLALIVTSELGMSSAAFGVMLAIGAIGGLAGAAFADRKPRLSLSTVAATVITTTTISLVLLGLLPSVSSTAIALVVTSGGFAMWNVYMVSARQRATPNELLGRVGAAYRTVVSGAGLIGMVAGGIIANAFSVRTSIIVASLVLVAGGAPAVRALRTDQI